MSLETSSFSLYVYTKEHIKNENVIKTSECVNLKLLTNMYSFNFGISLSRIWFQGSYQMTNVL